jgi:hypothetical protein
MGADSLSRSRPRSIRFLKIRFGHRITTLLSQNSSSPTNFAVLSVFRSHIRCESFLSAPFVAVQFPVGAASLVADSPGGPNSTLSLEDCSSVELNNTRVPYDICGL